jgi:hypothetical protein
MTDIYPLNFYSVLQVYSYTGTPKFASTINESEPILNSVLLDSDNDMIAFEQPQKADSKLSYCIHTLLNERNT